MSEHADSFDVIVVGSGAGGLTAALRAHDQGLSTLVIEKTDRYGGTSAISGGGIWIPCNPQIEGLGGQDSIEDATTYVTAATRGEVPAPRIAAYLRSGPQMLRWLDKHTQLRFHALPKYPDYYQHLPEARPGFRTMEPAFFPAQRLGAEFARLREPAIGTLIMGRVSMGQVEAGILFSRAKGWLALTARRMLAYWSDIAGRLQGPRDRRLALGQALVAALRASMLDRDISLWLDTTLASLVTDASGRVTGIDAFREGRPVRISARAGVILAAGGFERNQAMRDAHLPAPSNAAWSATPPGNTGDAIRAGTAIGAATAFMDKAWWSPTVAVPGQAAAWPMLVERASPGCVIVNRLGKRFVNEASPYLEFGEAMYANHRAVGGRLIAWMIFDSRFRRKYAAGPLMPAQIKPDRSLPNDWRGKVYHKANSLEELAADIGVDPIGLAATISAMNRFAQTGSDLEFGKGGNVYDRYYGDPAVVPNPCLARIDHGPFYAIPLQAGDIGTKGGLLADAEARVLGKDGTPIQGLYAIGNTSAAVMGPAYPGPGSTLGPAMVMGYVAANTIAAEKST